MVSVDSEKLEEKATEIINYAEKEITDEINKILNLKNQATWEGATGTASMQEFTKFMNDMQKISLAIKQYGLFLRATAQKYRDTSTSVREIFERTYN